MEKLIELLNEFRETQGYKGGLVYGPFGAKQGDLNFIFDHTKFPFIKWLVENDKIRLPHELDELPQMYGVDYNSNECKSDRLIMLLAISSSPIDDLISYLK